MENGIFACVTGWGVGVYFCKFEVMFFNRKNIHLSVERRTYNWLWSKEQASLAKCIRENFNSFCKSTYVDWDSWIYFSQFWFTGRYAVDISSRPYKVTGWGNLKIKIYFKFKSYIENKLINAMINKFLHDS